MLLFNQIKVIPSLIFTLVFCLFGATSPSYATEAQDIKQKHQEFGDTQNQINEDDSIFKGLENENLFQKTLPLDIDSDSIFEFPKRKAINSFDFVDRNFYWLAGGFLGGSIAYRVIADPGFYECFLPNIAPYFVFAGGSCVGWYLGTKYGDEQNQRKQRERMDLFKKFQAQFIEGATEFMISTDSPEKHSANPQNS